MHSRIAPAFVILAAFAISQVSLAQTVAEAASRWGLLGSWRLDCTQPASRSNATLTYVLRNGRLFHDRDFGDAKDSNPVTLAAMLADGSIELTIAFGSLSQTRQFALSKGNDGRIRSMSNRNVDTNEYTIKDGRFVANGNDTPWQARCR